LETESSKFENRRDVVVFWVWRLGFELEMALVRFIEEASKQNMQDGDPWTLQFDGWMCLTIDGCDVSIGCVRRSEFVKNNCMCI
jgi:hypothetical protein